MSAGLLSTNVDDAVNFELTSLSRAGRNEAAHKSLTKKAAEAMDVERSAKQAAVRKKNRELAAETFEASTFGEGNTNDRKREEMCSSPRLHPQKEIQAKRDYRGQRMGVFEGLHKDVPKLDLVDIGGITVESERQYKEGKTPRTVEDDEDDANNSPLVGTDQVEEGNLRGAPLSPGIGDHTTSGGHRSVIHKPMPPAEKNRLRLERVASPLRSRKAPISHDSASFLSPSRWKESGAPKPPAVGHYRPKHLMVEHRVGGGVIHPMGSTTAREKPNYREYGATGHPHSARLSMTNPGLNAAAQAGKGGAAAQAGLGGPTVSNSGQDVSQQGDDLMGGVGKKAGNGPLPDKNSTYVFKSASPNRKLPLKTYGADAVYWPVNDNVTSARATDGLKGGVRFDRMRGRDPLDVKTAAPDATYPLVSGLATQCRVDMDRQAVRPPLSLPGAGDHGTMYYTEAGAVKDVLKHKRSPMIDFTKTSPRKPLYRAVPSVSVEEVEGDLSVYLQHSKTIPSLDKMGGRTDPKTTVNDLTYHINEEMTSPRLRGAAVREGVGTGHKALFNPTITDKCNYEPNPNAVRPKILREIDFSKDTARPANNRSVHMADLVYDTETHLTKHRMQGNPMMASHLTRAKRTKNMSARVYAPDTVYEVEHAGGAMGKTRDDKGSVDFSKHVPRYVIFKGRGKPSEKWLDAHPRAPGPGEYYPKSPNPAFDVGATTGAGGSNRLGGGNSQGGISSSPKKKGNSYNIHS